MCVTRPLCDAHRGRVARILAPEFGELHIGELHKGGRNSMGGFKKFLLRGNVVDLAVAVVIGAAFGAVVQALVKDLITPLIGAFGGVPDFSALFFTVNGSKFLIGDFINAVLSFALIAAVVYYFVVLPVGK